MDAQKTLGQPQSSQNILYHNEHTLVPVFLSHFGVSLDCGFENLPQ
jgi:hypothetical protein